MGTGFTGLSKTGWSNLKFKKNKSFEIKNSKKTRVHFKNFGENQIQKILD
jgi:hypothetical protein